MMLRSRPRAVLIGVVTLIAAGCGIGGGSADVPPPTTVIAAAVSSSAAQSPATQQPAGTAPPTTAAAVTTTRPEPGPTQPLPESGVPTVPEGTRLTIVGVAHDDLLNVRDLPAGRVVARLSNIQPDTYQYPAIGVYPPSMDPATTSPEQWGEPEAWADPLTGIQATGRSLRIDQGRWHPLWHAVTVPAADTTGWVSAHHVARLGPYQTITPTSDSGRPTAPTVRLLVEDVARRVATVYGGDPNEAVLVKAPDPQLDRSFVTPGGEVVAAARVDVYQMADGGPQGWRLTVFAGYDPDPDPVGGQGTWDDSGGPYHLSFVTLAAVCDPRTRTGCALGSAPSAAKLFPDPAPAGPSELVERVEPVYRGPVWEPADVNRWDWRAALDRFAEALRGQVPLSDAVTDRGFYGLDRGWRLHRWGPGQVDSLVWDDTTLLYGDDRPAWEYDNISPEDLSDIGVSDSFSDIIAYQFLADYGDADTVFSVGEVILGDNFCSDRDHVPHAGWGEFPWVAVHDPGDEYPEQDGWEPDYYTWYWTTWFVFLEPVAGSPIPKVVGVQHEFWLPC